MAHGRAIYDVYSTAQKHEPRDQLLVTLPIFGHHVSFKFRRISYFKSIKFPTELTFYDQTYEKKS